MDGFCGTFDLVTVRSNQEEYVGQRVIIQMVIGSVECWCQLN